MLKSLSKGSEAHHKKRDLWKEIKAYKTDYFLMMPFAVLFIIFIFIPVAIATVLSFTYFNMLQMPKFIGFDNYIRMFLDDDIFIIAVKNTLIFALITGPISYFACLFFAWTVNELTPKIRSVVTFLLYVPSISGSVFLIWTYIFSGDQFGLINSILLNANLILQPIQWLTDTKYMVTIVIIIQVWLSLGASFLSFIAGFQGIDKQMYEAGAIDGIKNRWQELWHITLPSMGPQLMFGAVIQIGAAFAIGSVGAALTGNPSTDYATHTVVLHMADMGTTRFEMGYASAIAVVLSIIMLLFNAIIRKILSRFTD